MEENNEENKTTKLGAEKINLTQNIPSKYVQIIAFVFLIVMFIVDKMTTMIHPPLEDLWYIAVASVAFFGSDFVSKIAERIFDKRK